MIERRRELRRRRHRQEKRRKLRAKLARTTDPQERAAIVEKILKTYPYLEGRDKEPALALLKTKA